MNFKPNELIDSPSVIEKSNDELVVRIRVDGHCVDEDALKKLFGKQIISYDGLIYRRNDWNDQYEICLRIPKTIKVLA